MIYNIYINQLIIIKKKGKIGKMRVIIAAAGTAGHINPGLAIANKIKEEQKDSKIIFIGTTRGLENDLVPRAGYELRTIDAYGLSKKISIENIKKMYKTFKGYGEAKKIINLLHKQGRTGRRRAKRKATARTSRCWCGVSHASR